MLKLAQREEALTRNIDYVEWTFDPTEVRNAILTSSGLELFVDGIPPMTMELQAALYMLACQQIG